MYFTLRKVYARIINENKCSKAKMQKHFLWLKLNICARWRFSRRRFAVVSAGMVFCLCFLSYSINKATELVKGEENEFPIDSNLILKNFYVDTFRGWYHIGPWWSIETTDSIENIGQLAFKRVSSDLKQGLFCLSVFMSRGTKSKGGGPNETLGDP